MKQTEVALLDEVFTHVNDDDGAQTSYNVTALYRHLTDRWDEVALAGVEKVVVPVDEDHGQYCMERRGVEQDRIAVLVQHPEYLTKPILFVAMPDGSHLLVDGTHRYVIWWMTSRDTGKPLSIPSYIIPLAVAAPFIIEDMPQTDEDELMRWSGLTVLRQLFK